MRSSLRLAWVALSVLPGMAAAQMSMPPVVSTFDLMMPVVMNPCPGGRCNALKTKVPAKPTERKPSTAPALSVGTYQPTAALAQQTASATVARMRQQNPAHAAQLARELQRIDYRASYADAVRSDGFRTDSLSDAMASYALLGWVIVHDRPDTSRAQATGVRRQFAAQVAANPQLLRHRAALAEELKLQFVIVASGYLAAKREGSHASYAQAMGGIMRQKYGLNLAALDLTDAGFQSR